MSLDGLRYAYTVPFGKVIHVVEIATGEDRSLNAPEGPDTLLYYAREGIYFNQDWEAPSSGLWLLDPSSGQIQRVFTDKHVDALGGFAAWLSDVNRADPHPVFSPLGGDSLANEILRRDMNGGATNQWFYRPGKIVTVIGLTQDEKPLIEVDTGNMNEPRELWIVPAANAGTLIMTGQFGRVMVDDHGIWIEDGTGISLYTAAGLRRVSNVSATPVGKCG